MKVILLQKVAGLGNADEIKEVADGYARNFLFPRHLAVQASPQMLQEIDNRHKREAKQAERDLREQQQLAARVDGREIEIKEKASESGSLYAAVNAQKVAEALQKQGFKVEKEQVIMKPIKELGSYSVKLKFRHGLEAEITAIVSAIQ